MVIAGTGGPYSFFCQVAKGAAVCTVKRSEGDGTNVVAVCPSVAAWIGIRAPARRDAFCLVVEGGDKWGSIDDWGSVSLKEEGMRGVILSCGAKTASFAGMPWLVGAGVPPEFEKAEGIAQWVFDTEGGEACLGGGVSGVSFLGGEVVIYGGELAIRGRAVSSPFDTSVSLDEEGGRILTLLTNGGGRFTASLHRGKLGPLVVLGARGGVALPVAGGRTG